MEHESGRQKDVIHYFSCPLLTCICASCLENDHNVLIQNHEYLNNFTAFPDMVTYPNEMTENKGGKTENHSYSNTLPGLELLLLFLLHFWD